MSKDIKNAYLRCTLDADVDVFVFPATLKHQDLIKIYHSNMKLYITPKNLIFYCWKK